MGLCVNTNMLAGKLFQRRMSRLNQSSPVKIIETPQTPEMDELKVTPSKRLQGSISTLPPLVIFRVPLRGRASFSPTFPKTAVQGFWLLVLLERRIWVRPTVDQTERCPEKVDMR